MPSLTRDEGPPTASATSKKRRRDEDDNYGSLYATPLPLQHPPLPSNHLPPSPSHVAVHSTTVLDHNNFAHHFDGAAEHAGAAGPAARKILPPTWTTKKQRTFAAADVKDRPVRSPASTPRPAPPPMTVSQYKRNHCHVCGRRPMVLADLDGYADCQGCGSRTCYVCIRQCLGWIVEPVSKREEDGGDAEHDKVMHDSAAGEGQQGRGAGTEEKAYGQWDKTMHDIPPGEAARPDPAKHASSPVKRPVHELDSTWWDGHREVVCSRCCIEKGTDGDVVCLGCLPYV